MKPQVLIFIDWYTPGYKAGGPVRSMVNLIANLHQQIDFFIVTGDTEYTENKPYSDIQVDQWQPGVYGESVFYSSRQFRTPSNWKALINERKWDKIYVNGIYSAWFSVMPLILTRKSSMPRIVASRGMLAPGAMAHGKTKKSLFLKAMKLFGAYRGVRWQATNDTEAAQIRKWIGSSTIEVVANLPKPQATKDPSTTTKEKGTLRVISVARIAVEKNTALALAALDQVNGQVRYDIYGPIYDEEYWQHCQHLIAELPSHIQVFNHGPIHPSAVAELLESAHLLLMPSAGENFGHTMLESLTAATPMIISDKTPWNGLREAKAGVNVPVQDLEKAVNELAETIQEFVNMNQQEYDLWSMGAFDYAKAYRQTDCSVEQMRELLS